MAGFTTPTSWRFPKAGGPCTGSCTSRSGSTCRVATPDCRWAVHRKLHVFVSPFLSPGDSSTVFDTPHGCRVGVLICYDNNIIENARATALLGAEILLAPHQTGGCNSVSPRAMKPVDPDIWARRTADAGGFGSQLVWIVRLACRI